MNRINRSILCLLLIFSGCSQPNNEVKSNDTEHGIFMTAVIDISVPEYNFKMLIRNKTENTFYLLHESWRKNPVIEKISYYYDGPIPKEEDLRDSFTKYDTITLKKAESFSWYEALSIKEGISELKIEMPIGHEFNNKIVFSSFEFRIEKKDTNFEGSCIMK